LARRGLPTSADAAGRRASGRADSGQVHQKCSAARNRRNRPHSSRICRESAPFPSPVDRVLARWRGAGQHRGGINVDKGVDFRGRDGPARAVNTMKSAARHRDDAAWSRARDGHLTGDRVRSGLAMWSTIPKSALLRLRVRAVLRQRSLVARAALRWIGAYEAKLRYNWLELVARIVHFMVQPTGAPNRSPLPMSSDAVNTALKAILAEALPTSGASTTRPSSSSMAATR
jgi:hypothetical protein